MFLFSGSVYGDDFQDGMDAFERKDYKEAVRLWKPLAEQGNVEEQYSIGEMYLNALNYKEAVKWLRLSADQGHSGAQYGLGVKYAKGTEFLQDYALAHMWFNLCSSIGEKVCVRDRNIIEKKMTQSQIEEAQKMARNWKPKK
jgi:uncharacterized protein